MSDNHGNNDNNNQSNEKGIRWEVFIPAFIFIGGAALVGIFNNKWLTKNAQAFFQWSLDTFGWLFQWAIMATFIIVLVVTFSKLGDIRIGGKDAKPKYSMSTWFAMALTGGVATGIVTWGVNEPLIYYGGVWKTLEVVGIKPGTQEAANFAMARSFYDWSFVPYAIYALSGLLVAYLYYNKKKRLNITATLEPVLGKKLTSNKGLSAVIDTLSMLAITIGLITGLTMCITLVASGLKGGYGIDLSTNFTLFAILGIAIVAAFSFSTFIGMDKGLKVLGNLNAAFYYGLLILLFFTGGTLFICKIGTAGVAIWMDNFFKWGLDPNTICGNNLTQQWTLFDWAFWVGYAPVTGIFLAMLSYGRTIRQFMLVNWILPSIFGIIWFSIMGGSALNMQMNGGVDLVGALNSDGALAALWVFLKHLPFHLGVIVIPVNILIILVSFITAADASLTNIGSMCMKNVPIGTEPPPMLKVLWGVVVGVIAIIMAFFGKGVQGVDGVKALAAVAGFVVLFIFILQIVSFVKVFFVKKPTE